MREDMLQHEARDPVCRMLFRNLAAHRFHHLTEMHTRRTRRLASAAVETAEHMLFERRCDLRPAFVECAHQVDPASRRIHLAAEDAICRTRRQAESAMHAIQIEWSFLGLHE